MLLTVRVPSSVSPECQKTSRDCYWFSGLSDTCVLGIPLWCKSPIWPNELWKLSMISNCGAYFNVLSNHISLWEFAVTGLVWVYAYDSAKFCLLVSLFFVNEYVEKQFCNVIFWDLYNCFSRERQRVCDNFLESININICNAKVSYYSENRCTKQTWENAICREKWAHRVSLRRLKMRFYETQKWNPVVGLRHCW